jgi:hypothetical protein
MATTSRTPSETSHPEFFSDEFEAIVACSSNINSPTGPVEVDWANYNLLINCTEPEAGRTHTDEAHPDLQAPLAPGEDIKYSDPALDGYEDSKTVPILRSTREFIRRSTPHRWTQFPIAVAYAITVHKSQDIDKTVPNLTEKDFTSGLAYVGESNI